MCGLLPVFDDFKRHDLVVMAAHRDDAWAAFDRCQAELDARRAEEDRLRSELAAAQAQRQRLGAQLNEMRASLSMRITRPRRALRGLISRGHEG